MNTIQALINLFRDFPTVGPRTAGRFVYYLIRQPKEKTDELISALQELKNKIKICPECFSPFESACPICSDPRRDKNLLCVVEKETDLLSLENTKKYNGLYFILGGTVGMMRKEDVSQLRVEEFKNRIKKNNFTEIIVALNPTPEGKVTSTLIENIIKENLSPAPKITRLARGIPAGGELEYADEETLGSALLGRN